MADPISTAASIVGLTAFAIESSKVLYNTIEKIKSNGKSVREMKEEIGSLAGILESLQETLAISQINLSALEIPLSSCDRLCKEYTALVERCSARIDSGRFSFRDFLTFTYKGKDIIELRSLISTYKSTISIALADANIRQVTITTNLLQEYKRTINDTTCDLNEHLERYKEMPSDLLTERHTTASVPDIEPSDITEEKTSIEACLRICASVSRHIDELQNESVFVQRERSQNRNVITLTNSSQASEITSRRLQDCKTEIGFTSAELKIHLREVEHRLAKLTERSLADGDASTSVDGTTSMEEELNSIRQCLSICQKATEQVTSERVNVFEDVNMAEDGEQLIVSTFGDLISARRVTAGPRSKQLLGQMTDASVQYALRPRKNFMSEETAAERGSVTKNESTSQFSGRFGAGRRLS